MTADDSTPSLFPHPPDGAETETPAKRPRGRPRKTADGAPTKPATKASTKTPARKTAAAKPVKRVPRDQPVEWVVPRNEEAPREQPKPAPADPNPVRATAVRPIDEETVRHPSDALDDADFNAVSEAEIRARREAARAVVADIGRMKDEVKSMNSYIAAPPADRPAVTPAPDADSIEHAPPLSRRDYWKQRRQERYLQRQQRRVPGPNGVVADAPVKPAGRFDRAKTNPRVRPPADAAASQPAPSDVPPPLKVSDLQALAPRTLNSMADEQGIAETLASPARHDVVFALLRNHAARGGTVIGEGVLDVCQEGHGYLRNPWNAYKSCPEDAMVPLQVIRRFGLRPGDRVSGPTRPPTRDQRERRFVIVDVTAVNGVSPADSRQAPFFDSQTATHPDRPIRLETRTNEAELRVVELFAPMGFGQRGLILAPPRAGRRVLLRKLANAILANHPEAEVLLLLIDERPEEVTDLIRKTEAKVFASTFDDDPASHVQMATVVLDLARRTAERGRDVVILMDSLTRLVRACAAEEASAIPVSGATVHVSAFQKARQLFAAARNMDEGGSLTILATASIETGNRNDQLVAETFADHANWTIRLNREFAQKQLYPAIDLAASGTDHEALLLGPEVLEAMHVFRRQVLRDSPEAMLRQVLGRIADTTDNTDLLASASKD